MLCLGCTLILPFRFPFGSSELWQLIVRGVPRKAPTPAGAKSEVNGPSLPLLEVQVEKAPVVRPAGCHHHVVDRGRQVTEEPFDGSGIRGVEGRGAQRFELVCGALKAFGIPAGEDQLGPLSACSPGRFEPDTGATADHDDGLPEEFRFALDGKGGGCGAHYSSKNLLRISRR